MPDVPLAPEAERATPPHAAAGVVDGRLFSLGFALMPNRLGCGGGPDQRDDDLAGRADAGLDRLLRKCEGAMPYLRLIAAANGVADPLDARVVEAYWLGNGLLDQNDLRAFYRSLAERFRGRLAAPALERLLGKVPAGLDTLERCRIGWRTVLALSPRQVVVSGRPLVWEGHRLALGAPVVRELVRHLEGYCVLPDLWPGDVVAYHWGWVAAWLNPRQAGALHRETVRHFALANQTL